MPWKTWNLILPTSTAGIQLNVMASLCEEEKYENALMIFKGSGRVIRARQALPLWSLDPVLLMFVSQWFEDPVDKYSLIMFESTFSTVFVL